MSSAEGTGSDNPFAGYGLLPLHNTYDDQSDAVYDCVDEYVESVYIEEHQGGDDRWTEELSGSESSGYEESGSTASSVVGTTSTELESFNELIKFDHMYFRQPSKDCDKNTSEKSLDQSKIEALEVVSKVACEDEVAGLASDEDLNLSSFSESDLAQLTNCLDWLIDASGDVLLEDKTTISRSQEDTSSCLASLDDIESSCLLDHVDSLSSLTDDSFISTNHFDYSTDKQNLYTSTFSSNFVNISSEDLLKSNELNVKRIHDRKDDTVDIRKLSEGDSMFLIDSTVNCTSPCSSSGCESDLSSSTYEDEHLSFSTDIGLMDLTDEPFTELFPALY